MRERESQNGWQTPSPHIARLHNHVFCVLPAPRVRLTQPTSLPSSPVAQTKSGPGWQLHEETKKERVAH